MRPWNYHRDLVVGLFAATKVVLRFIRTTLRLLKKSTLAWLFTVLIAGTATAHILIEASVRKNAPVIEASLNAAVSTSIIQDLSGQIEVYALPLPLVQKTNEPYHILATPPIDRNAQQVQQAYKYLIAIEDKRLGKTIGRYRGIDFPALTKAIWGETFGDNRRGASTLYTLIVSNGVMYSNDPGSGFVAYKTKLKELWLTMAYHKSIDGDLDKLKYDLATYLPCAYGGRSVAIHGFEQCAELFFDKPLNSLSKSEVAILVGVIQKPINLSFNKERQTKLWDNAKRRAIMARRIVDKLSDSEVSSLRSIPMPNLENKTPAQRALKAFTAEGIQMHLQESYTQKSSSRFSITPIQTAMFNEQMNNRRKLSNKLCTLSSNLMAIEICPDKTSYSASTLFVQVDARTNQIEQFIGLGANLHDYYGHGSVERPPIGSIAKLLYTPLLPNWICKSSSPSLLGLHDADGSIGNKTCNDNTDFKPLRDALRRSENISIAYGLMSSNSNSNLMEYIRALGFTPPNDDYNSRNVTARSMVLGRTTGSPADILRAYSALTAICDGRSAIAHTPKAILGDVKKEWAKHTDLTKWVKLSDRARICSLLEAPTERPYGQKPGTAYRYGEWARSQGYDKVWAKTGTSEAGKTSIRGRFLVGGYVDELGHPKIFYLAIQSQDGGSLAHTESTFTHHSLNGLAIMLLAKPGESHD